MTARRRDSTTEVIVSRVYQGDDHVRVSTIGTAGERPFILVPGIGITSSYFDR